MKKVVTLLMFLSVYSLLSQPFANVAVLNGTTDYIEVPDAYGTDFNNAVSVEAWINPCDVSGYRVISSKWYCSGDDNGFFFTILNGKLRFTWDSDACANGSNTFQSNAAIIQTNQWQHIAVTHDSSSVHLYLNGVLVPGTLNIGSSYSTIQTSTQKLRIGAYRIGSSSYFGHYEGLIDEVRVWDTKRTASEIATNYQISLTGGQADLVGYYKMNISNSGSAITVPNSATSTGTAVDGTTAGTLITPSFNAQDFNAISSVLGPDTLVCANLSSYLLDATSTVATYLWDDGTTNATKTVSSSSLSTVIITIGCNKYYDSVQVTFQSPPSINLGVDTTLCTGDSMLLDFTNNSATYLWQDGSTSSSFNITQAGNYSVTLTENGCTATDDINVVFVAPASIDLGPDHSICHGNTVALDATNASSSYIWSTGSISSSISVSQTGTYHVEVDHFCGVVTDTVTITVNPLPVVDLGADTSLCLGETLQLDVIAAGGTVLWQDGSNSAQILVTQTGTYSVTVTDNGCSATDDIDVSYIAPVLVDLGPDHSICQGNSVPLDATSPSASYLWSTGATSSSIVVNQTAVYFVEVSHFCGTTKDTVSITVNLNPYVDLGNDSTLCNGDNLVVDATLPGATYLWQDGSTAPTYNITGDGSYSVTVEKNGCSSFDQIVASYVAPAVVNLGPDHSICNGDSVLLDATNQSATYLWSTGASSASIKVHQTGTYYVDLNHFCGSVRDTVTIIVNPIPSVNLGPDTTICTGQTLTLDGSVSGANYVWQDGSIGAHFNVTLAGTYSVTVAKNGCSSTDDIIVSEVAPATVNLGPDHSICQGSSVLLDATNAQSTYFWSNGVLSPTTTITQTGIYYVDVDHYCGTVTDTVSIVVNSIPTVDLGIDTTICMGQTLTLDANITGASYVWQDGSTGAQMNVNQGGTYSVTITNNGCSSVDDIIVDVIAPATIDLGPDQVICQGGSVLLDATNSSASYLWSTGSMSPTAAVTQTGVYFIDVNHYCGLVTDTISIIVNPLPTADLGADTTICSGETLTLDATVLGATYLWQDGSMGSQLNVSSAGTYSVTISENGCSSNDDINISIASLQVDLGNDLILCEGENVMLSAVNTGADYLWQDGQTTSNYNVVEPGLYIVKVSNIACETIDSVEVKYELVDKQIDVEVIANCGSANLNLFTNPLSNNSSTISNLLWTIDEKFKVIGNSAQKQFTEAGVYEIKLSTTSGSCQIDTTFDVYVDVFEFPKVDFSISNTTPDVEEVIYTTNHSEAELKYTWNFGNGEVSNDLEPTFAYNKASSYTVSLTAENENCQASSDILISVKEPLLYFIPNAFTPNGNQYNNTFQPVFTSGFDPYNYELRIYDRWGEILFISNDPNIGWDGSYRGQNLDNGVYIWEVLFGQIDNSGRVVDKGTVTLLK